MLRMTGRGTNGQKFLLLGLDRENLIRLTSGKPIVCRGETVGLEHDVIIVFGETLDDVRREIMPHRDE